MFQSKFAHQSGGGPTGKRVPKVRKGSLVHRVLADKIMPTEQKKKCGANLQKNTSGGSRTHDLLRVKQM